MPETKNTTKDRNYLGERVFFEWRAPEYRNFRKLKQYLPFVLIVVAFSIIWALYFSNYIFAFLLLIIGAVAVVVGYGRPPKSHQFAITDSGLWVDKELRSFIDCKYFSVVPYATRQDRFFVFQQTKKGKFRVPVPIADAERIRLAVNQYVPQKEYTGGAIESFDRMFW